MEDPCPYCGRAGRDWSDREPGTKKDQLPGDDEDKAVEYVAWHRKQGPHLLAMDMDQMEYRIIDGESVPVAFIELTRISGAPNPPPSYFRKINIRAGIRDNQIAALRAVARRARLPMYYVAFMPDGSEFHVADLLDESDPPTWKRYSESAYVKFLNDLRPIEVAEERPMTDRLELDEEKLREAVGFFRTNANLHASSSDEALIRYAHEGGKGKPHANMIRDCWHDFENGRRYASLPVTPYQIKYQTQAQLFEPLDAKQREGAGESDAKVGVTEAPAGDDDPVPSRSPADCPHSDMVLDETGRENVCAECGELLGPADPIPNGNESGSDEGKGKVAASDASGTASDPNGASGSKQPKSDDEEEVLF